MKKRAISRDSVRAAIIEAWSEWPRPTDLFSVGPEEYGGVEKDASAFFAGRSFLEIDHRNSWSPVEKAQEIDQPAGLYYLGGLLLSALTVDPAEQEYEYRYYGYIEQLTSLFKNDWVVALAREGVLTRSQSNAIRIYMEFVEEEFFAGTKMAAWMREAREKWAPFRG